MTFASSSAVGYRAVAAPSADRRLVFQQFALFASKTVHETIDFGLRGKGLPKRFAGYALRDESNGWRMVRGEQQEHEAETLQIT